jgi:Mrp family chromosome partitioning ATPase
MSKTNQNPNGSSKSKGKSSFLHRKQKENDMDASLVIPASIGRPETRIESEVINSMRLMLNRLGRKEPLPTSISMVSAIRGEGVSYLSLALGATIAHDLMANVCVVELNWWWPSTTLQENSTRTGLGSVLKGETNLQDAVIESGFRHLSWLSAGILPREQRPVIARSPHIKKIIEVMKEDYDYLILDIPAILATQDAVPLAALGETCCMVVQQGVTSVEDVRSAMDEISHLKISGIIMNRFRINTPATFVKLISAL